MAKPGAVPMRKLKGRPKVDISLFKRVLKQHHQSLRKMTPNSTIGEGGFKSLLIS